MSNPKSRLLFLILAAIALGAAPAFAQEPVPLGGRFLDLLHPGQRVRLNDMGQQDPAGLQLTLVPEAQWKEIEQRAKVRMERIKELEDQLTKLNNQRDEILSVFQLPSPGERTGLDRNAINELQRSQQKIQQESQEIYNEISALRRKLPSSINRIEVVGEDYFGLDSGNAVVFYPASRLREITRLKATEPATDEQPAGQESSDENTEGEAEASAEPAEANPSPADNADAKN